MAKFLSAYPIPTGAFQFFSNRTSLQSSCHAESINHGINTRSLDSYGMTKRRIWLRRLKYTLFQPENEKLNFNNYLWPSKYQF